MTMSVETGVSTHRSGVSPIQLRLMEARADIDCSAPSHIAFQHSALCQLGLPRRDTSKATFERRCGAASIFIQAGALWSGSTWEPQRLPYGGRARLVLIHICSRAIVTRSQTVEVGATLREFLTRLSIDPCGIEYRRVWAQIKALAACTIRIGFGDGLAAPATTLDARPFAAWEDIGSRWPGIITLTKDFYIGLLDHGVPLNPRALAALRHSALALDVYTWAAHRLHRLDRPLRLGWPVLQGQFGGEYRSARDFRREFLRALAQVRDAYPAAQIQQPPRGGLLLLPSPPPITRREVSACG
ncbi:MAG: replication protein RepA [Rhodospirillaceae bacterium]